MLFIFSKMYYFAPLLSIKNQPKYLKWWLSIPIEIMVCSLIQDRRYVDKKNWIKRVTEGISSYQIIVNDLSSKDLDNRVHEWSPQSIKYNASGDKNLHRMMVIGTVDFFTVWKSSRRGNWEGNYFVLMYQNLTSCLSDYRPCGWNDTIFVEDSICKLLDQHTEHRLYVMELFKVFHIVTYLNASGQCLNTFGTREPSEGTCSLDFFTEEKYKLIAKHKTAYYTMNACCDVGWAQFPRSSWYFAIIYIGMGYINQKLRLKRIFKDCMLLSCHVRVSDWIYKFAWISRNSLLEAGTISEV